MVEWLAHPMEFGVKPTKATYVGSFEAPFLGEDKPLTVHIVEYQMPDGTYGKGFVGPLTWSFVGKLPYDKLTNIQLVTAYSGWLWLFSALQNKKAETDFVAKTKDALVQQLAKQRIDSPKVTAQYRVGDSEFFEFTGQRSGVKVKGAGSIESQLILDETAPQASLPVVYTFLGMVMKGET